MKYAYEHRIGTRTEMGTDWPIYAVVYRSGKSWTSGKLCNGVMISNVTIHRLLRDAISAAKELTDQAGSVNMYGEAV